MAIAEIQEDFEARRDNRGKNFYSIGRSWATEGLGMYFNSKYKYAGACKIHTLDFGLSDYENRIASLDYFFSVQHEAQSADDVEQNFLYDFVYLTKDHTPIYTYSSFNPYLVRFSLPLKGNDRKYFRWRNDLLLFSSVCEVLRDLDKDYRPKTKSMASELLGAMKDGIIRDFYYVDGSATMTHLIHRGKPLEDCDNLPFRSYPQDLLDFLKK
ncbi:MAG: hypothetical protein ACR2MS_07795 [Weeksellaceae bacterium]